MYVSTKWNEGELKGGVPASYPNQRGPKPNGKPGRVHPKEAGYRVVAQLVNKDEYVKANDEENKGHALNQLKREGDIDEDTLYVASRHGYLP